MNKYLMFSLLVVLLMGVSFGIVYYKQQTDCVRPVFLGIVGAEKNDHIEVFVDNELVLDYFSPKDTSSSTSGDDFLYLKFYRCCPSDSTLKIRMVFNQNYDTSFTGNVSQVAGYVINSLRVDLIRSKYPKPTLFVYEEKRTNIHTYKEFSPWYELWRRWELLF